MTTVILTGQAGTGKTMLARIFVDLGIPMVLSEGEPADSIEDADMKFHLTYFPFSLPIHLIKARNEAHKIWGFKFASLNNCLAPITINQFRDPRIVMLHRDVVAVANHNNFDYARALEEEQRLFYFARHVEAPVLHLSSDVLFRSPKAALMLAQDFLSLSKRI